MAKVKLTRDVMVKGLDGRKLAIDATRKALSELSAAKMYADYCGNKAAARQARKCFNEAGKLLAALLAE
jgi:hypothetical protein